jgi:hypothetical protein
LNELSFKQNYKRKKKDKRNYLLIIRKINNMFGKLFGKKDAPKEKAKIDPAEAMRKIQESCDTIAKRASVLE